MKYVIGSVILLLVMAITLSLPSSASACSCLPTTGSPEQGVMQARDRADAVFTGRVVNIEERAIGNVTYTVATLEVSQIWKGTVGGHVEIVGGSKECCMCGYEFSIGGSYLIYASKQSSGNRLAEFQSGACTTIVLEEAELDIKVLSQLQSQDEVVGMPKTGASTLGAITVLAAAAATILLLVALKLRRLVR